MTHLLSRPSSLRRAERLIHTPELTKFQMSRGERHRKTKDQLRRTSDNLQDARRRIVELEAALVEIDKDHYGCQQAQEALGK